VTITGGKWTTYRKMAEDTIDVAAREGKLAAAPCVTADLPVHGSPGTKSATPKDAPYAAYGTDRDALLALERDEPSLAERLDPRLPYTGAEVVHAARAEYARAVDDVLARRTRALFTDVAAARASAPRVAQLLARELGRDDTWQSEQCAAFGAIAREDAAAFA
jgi:glycerol-3-phosphate dehydrogenase